MNVVDEVRAEQRADQARREANRKLGLDSDDDDAPKTGRILTGSAASTLADSVIRTGDPLIDEWEREELEDDEPIRFIDGPATGENAPGGMRALARYFAPR
jgi:hypothetical protein